MSGAMPSHSPVWYSFAFLGLLLTRFSLKGCERKKIWMNPGGKKKERSFQRHLQSPLCCHYLPGVLALSPGAAYNNSPGTAPLFLFPG